MMVKCRHFLSVAVVASLQIRWKNKSACAAFAGCDLKILSDLYFGWLNCL